MKLTRQLMETRTVFYRSRFEVFPDGDINAEIWQQIVFVLQKWLEGKERRRANEAPLRVLSSDLIDYSDNFKCTYQSCFISNSFARGKFDEAGESSLLSSRAAFTLVDDLVPTYWAMDYIEQDSALWFRRWYTNVGITASGSGYYIVNVRVSILDDPAYLSAQPRLPQRNTPRFIGDMLDIPNCVTLAGEMNLKNEPVALTSENFDEFLEDLGSETRTIPMLVITPFTIHPSVEYLVNPRELASKIRGSANVYTLDISDQNLRDKYYGVFHEETSAYQYRINKGMLRIFFPGVDLEDAAGAKRHHYYPATILAQYNVTRLSDDICGAITRLYRRRSGEALDILSVENQKEKIRRRAQIEKLREQQEELAIQANEASRDANLQSNQDKEHYEKALRAKDVELKSARELIKTYEDLFDEASDGNNEVVELESKVESLQDKIQSLEQSLSARDYRVQMAEAERDNSIRKQEEMRDRLSLIDEMHVFPKTAVESLNFAARVYSRQLLVLDRAYDAAKLFKNGDSFEVFDILRSMATTLWDLIFVERNENNIAMRFRDETGYELTFRESSMTKSDPKLMKQRECEYKGQIVDISPHVKGKCGNKNAILRIHFYVDRDDSLIVIGHCGGHLQTSGTKRRSL